MNHTPPPLAVAHSPFRLRSLKSRVTLITLLIVVASIW